MDNVIVAVQYHSISITAHLCAEPASGYVIVRNGGEPIRACSARNRTGGCTARHFAIAIARVDALLTSTPNQKYHALGVVRQLLPIELILNHRFANAK